MIKREIVLLPLRPSVYFEPAKQDTRISFELRSTVHYIAYLHLLLPTHLPTILPPSPSLLATQLLLALSLSLSLNLLFLAYACIQQQQLSALIEIAETTCEFSLSLHLLCCCLLLSFAGAVAFCSSPFLLFSFLCCFLNHSLLS